MKLLAVTAVVALSATAPTASAERPKLDLIGFFTGRTHAESTLKVAFRRPARHVTDTVGRREADGDFILVDTVNEEGKPTKQRRWEMRASGPDRFTGTMTEAVGPVRITVEGPTARIRYKMKGGISVDQKLTKTDERTLSNHVSARRLALRVARLDGTIRKLD